MTIQELTNLIIQRSAVLAAKLSKLIAEGDVECNLKHDQILCDLWKLQVILETINNPDALKAATDTDGNILEYWGNTITTYGGFTASDFIVSQGLFLSLNQYYNTSNGSGGGGGSDDCVCFLPVNGIGRNFSTPTVFNQNHVYNDINQLAQALLFPSQPPTASASGEFTLNGSPTFVPFTTLEKGTIVGNVRFTITGTQGINGGQIVQTTTSLPTPTPVSPTTQIAANSVTQVYTSTVNNSGIITWAAADQSAKSYNGTVTDSKSAVATSNSVGYSYAVKLYYGPALVPGTPITETFIKSLPFIILDNDQFQSFLSVTTGLNQHIWFFHEDILGNTIFTDLAVNISGGFTRISGATLLPNGTTVNMVGSTISVAGINGYSAAYRGYVSDNSNLGVVNFKTTAS